MNAVPSLNPDKAVDDSWLDDNPDRLNVIDWRALAGLEPPPRFWHLPEWHGDAPTGLFGAGGKGKSLVAQTLGTALACGLEYFTAAPPAPVNVLYWACEDDRDELWRRQAEINRHFGIGMEDVAGRLIVEARRGLDNSLYVEAFGKPMFTALRDELAEQVGDYRTPVVILDNIAQLFGGKSQDAHHVTSFVNGIAGIGAGKSVAHFAPLLLGHVARTQGSEYAGSAAWENACRMRWYLGSSLPDQAPDEDDDDPDAVYLAKRKSNYSSKDFVKLTYRNGVMVPPSARGYEYDPAADTAEKVLLSAFDRIVASGVTVTDSKNSPDYLPSVVKRMDLSRTFSKKELSAAMYRLMGQGLLVRKVVGTYQNRNPRQGLARP